MLYSNKISVFGKTKVKKLIVFTLFVEKILITGGAGFIGSHLVKHFSFKYNVVVYDVKQNKDKQIQLKDSQFKALLQYTQQCVLSVQSTLNQMTQIV